MRPETQSDRQQQPLEHTESDDDHSAIEPGNPTQSPNMNTAPKTIAETSSTTHRTPLPISRYFPQESTRGRVLKYQDLVRCFHLPINSAALKLGVCVTALKKQCRKHGILRWPHRKLKSLDKLKEKLEREEATAADKEYYKHEIHSIAKKKDHIFGATPTSQDGTILPFNPSIPPNCSLSRDVQQHVQRPNGIVHTTGPTYPSYASPYNHPPQHGQHPNLIMATGVPGHATIPAQASYPQNFPTSLMPCPLGVSNTICGIIGCDCAYNNGVSSQQYHVPIPFHPNVQPPPFANESAAVPPNLSQNPSNPYIPTQLHNYGYPMAMPYQNTQLNPPFQNMLQFNMIDNQAFTHPSAGHAENAPQPPNSQMLPSGHNHHFIDPTTGRSFATGNTEKSTQGKAELDDRGLQNGHGAGERVAFNPNIVPKGNTTAVLENSTTVPNQATAGADKGPILKETPVIASHYWPTEVCQSPGGGNTFTMFNQTTHFHHHHSTVKKIKSTSKFQTQAPRPDVSKSTASNDSSSSSSRNGRIFEEEKTVGTERSKKDSDDGKSSKEAAGSSDELVQNNHLSDYLENQNFKASQSAQTKYDRDVKAPCADGPGAEQIDAFSDGESEIGRRKKRTKTSQIDISNAGVLMQEITKGNACDVDVASERDAEEHRKTRLGMADGALEKNPSIRKRKRRKILQETDSQPLMPRRDNSNTGHSFASAELTSCSNDEYVDDIRRRSKRCSLVNVVSENQAENRASRDKTRFGEKVAQHSASHYDLDNQENSEKEREGPFKDERPQNGATPKIECSSKRIREEAKVQSEDGEIELKRSADNQVESDSTKYATDKNVGKVIQQNHEIMDPPSPGGGLAVGVRQKDTRIADHSQGKYEGLSCPEDKMGRVEVVDPEGNPSCQRQETRPGSDGVVNACTRSRARRYEQFMLNCLGVGCAHWTTDRMLRVTLSVGPKTILGMAGVGSVGQHIADSASGSAVKGEELRKRCDNALSGHKSEWTISAGKRHAILIVAPFRKRSGMEIVGVCGLIVEISSTEITLIH